MTEHKKILLMGSGGIGDALFLTPATRAVRSNFPRARISLFFAGKGHIIFKRNTSVDDVIPAPFASHWDRDKPEESLVRGHYDLAIIFNRDTAYRDPDGSGRQGVPVLTDPTARNSLGTWMDNEDWLWWRSSRASGWRALTLASP